MIHRRLRLDALVLAATVLVSGVLVWHELFHGWFDVDDGGMGQVAARVLAGQLPHRDFDDPWTGGWSYFQAGVFQLFGPSLAALRVPIFVAWLGALALAFVIARRLADRLVAALVTLACATWSLYAWHFPLPNWYYLPLALFSAWAAVRFTETRHRRWLVMAGLGAGLALDIKITGLFLFAALLLWSLSLPARDETFPTDGAGGRGFGILAHVLAGAWSLMVLGLIWRLPMRVSPFVHFVVPNALVALWAAREASRARFPLVRGTVALLRLVIPITTGALIGVAPMIIWFASQRALHDLWLGVLVRPAVRLTVTFLPPPGSVATAMMAVAPGLLLLGSRAARVRARGATLAMAVGLAVIAGALTHRSGDAVDFATIVIRAVPIVLPFVGLWWYANLRDDPGRTNLALLLVALSATGQLIQIPYARLQYFLYAAPLMILAVAALLGRRRESAAGATIFAMVFLVVAGAGHPAWNAMNFPPGRWATLPFPRGGILVAPEDSARYADVARVMSTRPPGPVYVAFESPQYAFLLDRPNPSRVIYDLTADSATRDPTATLALLDRAGVRTAIVSLQDDGFWHVAWAARTGQLRMLRRAFPYQRAARGIEIRWRDRVPPTSAPVVAPRDEQH